MSGKECSMHGRKESACTISVENPETILTGRARL
jgi:hypothetical protein